MRGENVLVLSVELLAVFVGVYYWKYLTVVYKLFLIQCMLAFINELTAWAIQYYTDFSNSYMFNVYAIIEVWLLGAACILNISKQLARKLVVGALIALTIYWLFNVIRNGILTFNNKTVVAIAIFYVVSFFLLLINNSIFNDKKIYKQPLFVIAIAIIIYYATIIPFFALMNYLTTNNMPLAIKLFKINIVAAILRYSLVAIAFYLYGRQAKRAYVR